MAIPWLHDPPPSGGATSPAGPVGAVSWKSHSGARSVPHPRPHRPAPPAKRQALHERAHRGTRFHPGFNVGIGKDDTIFALIDGHLSIDARAERQEPARVH